jgi:hypothetical protein
MSHRMSRRRTTTGIAAAATVLAATVSSLGTLASAPASAAVGPELVKNGTFSARLSGWGADNTRTRLDTTPYGISGTTAGRVTARRSGFVGLTDTVPTVPSAVAGSQYAAKAAVRTSQRGVVARITVREVQKGTVVNVTRRPLTLGDTSWHTITVPVTATRAGAALDINVQAVYLRAGQRLVVDSVSLRSTYVPPLPVVTTPTPTSAPCSFSERGIPSPGCGPLLGAAYNSNTDPSVWEAELGRSLGVRRTYWGPTQVASAVTVAKADVAKHRIPWISFKLPHSWADMAAGKGDVWVRDLATRLAQVDGPVWVAFHHEPEGDGPIADWTAMQEHLAPIVRSTAPNVAYTAILMGWYQISGDVRYSLDKVWPNTTIDIAGFDPYNWYGTKKSNGTVDTKAVDMKAAYFDPISTWAAGKKMAWAVAETGYTNVAHTADPTWLPRTFAGLKSDHGIAMAYFNTPLNSEETWTWVLGGAKKTAFATTLAGTASLR